VDNVKLSTIKMWLECPVEETDDRGRKTRTTAARDNRRGIPQGSPISPMLANLYMRRFVLGWKMLGLEQSLGSRIVTYADKGPISRRTWRRLGERKGLQQILPGVEDQKARDRPQVVKEGAAWSDFLSGRAPEFVSDIAGGMKGESQQVERDENRGQVLFAVAEIVFDMVALGFGKKLIMPDV
jgi:hypothetical protein